MATCELFRAAFGSDKDARREAWKVLNREGIDRLIIALSGQQECGTRLSLQQAADDVYFPLADAQDMERLAAAFVKSEALDRRRVAASISARFWPGTEFDGIDKARLIAKASGCRIPTWFGVGDRITDEAISYLIENWADFEVVDPDYGLLDFNWEHLSLEQFARLAVAMFRDPEIAESLGREVSILASDNKSIAGACALGFACLMNSIEPGALPNLIRSLAVSRWVLRNLREDTPTALRRIEMVGFDRLQVELEPSRGNILVDNVQGIIRRFIAGEDIRDELRRVIPLRARDKLPTLAEQQRAEMEAYQ
ncbi:hypothetical protein N0754_17815 [Pseudomonas aeruginosa]|nr:hypothetical protein [Pseudomonas aeruginosa]MCS9764089.1 hypothetical protein [Pseudomonas aeruginosa]MCS9820266.1 hypothetical protein [Pseudomonas aeruginosa]MCT0240847.1 hypothetical protein [Pseudomonas aeruginosa]MCT0528299.1 hypothetical protein [Pseudomonas aeruginosa]